MEKKTAVRVHLLVILLSVCLKSADGYNYYAYCAARPTVVRVDKPQDRYFPFFVTLNRCGGSCSTHPGIQLCSPLSEEEINIQVFDPTYDRQVAMKMSNHTKCKCMCVASFDSCHLELEKWEPENCRCRCRYLNGPPNHLACKQGFTWIRDACRCRCNRPPEDCPIRKVWNQEFCGCVCSRRVIRRCERKSKGLDNKTCECIDVQALQRNPQEQPRSRMLITLLAGQGFLLVVVICVLIYYVRKSKREPSTSEGNSSSTQLPHSHSDFGNVSFKSSQSTYDALIPNYKPHYKTSNGSIHIERESTI